MKNVRNVNKGKRHKKKHYFKVGDSVVFKFYGDRDYGFISKLTMSDGIAQYSIKSTKNKGLIVHTYELDDPDDPMCYISSVLTKSITKDELQKIQDHKDGKHIAVYNPKREVKPTTPEKVVDVTPKPKSGVNKTELKKAIQKQKDFVNGKLDKTFW